MIIVLGAFKSLNERYRQPTLGWVRGVEREGSNGTFKKKNEETLLGLEIVPQGNSTTSGAMAKIMYIASTLIW